jgi:NADPH-dependent glutamate synthase beta subunit-like oxidoreductase/NAD(P)H-flavin reductase
MLNLRHNLAFEDLYLRDGLLRVDAAFMAHLGAADAALRDALMRARADPDQVARKAESELLIALAPHLEDFLAQLFAIEKEVQALAARHNELAPLYAVKRLFVQRHAMKIKPEELVGFDADAAERSLSSGAFSELAFAQAVTAWQEDEAANADMLQLATRYAAWAANTAEGQARHAAGVLFKAPGKLDYQHLVPLHSEDMGGYTRHRLDHLRRREGFALTDHGTDLVGALDEANYCIWCHNQGRDSCSLGLREKAPKGQENAPVVYKKSPFGVTLAGCPLEEKISEFHLVKTRGESIAALAIIVVDNPMAAATGHRICNDCMKACIYQKQDPVDIPQAETRTLKDVLELPWGFEIYSLLTRWNPLNLRRPNLLPESGRKVLVVGLGPAGFTLAHHLMNDGHTVVGIDGLKIETLPPELCGVDIQGHRVAFQPIRNVKDLEEPLGARTMAGFGGVAEYGITVRWDKNFLKMIRLLVERRARFRMFGGVRFGGTITLDDAWKMGFDHVALCIGAGGPTVLDIPNGLARGVRSASDFLMALQLTGAAKQDSIANMQLRLPVVVIGGGLTAIDTATESLAYYVVQVEKFLARYETLAKELHEDQIRAAWDDYEREIGEEFLAHARAIRHERKQAAQEGRESRIIELLRHWGGVTIAYRRRLIDSPSYTLNHEEVEKALEEGIWFAEGLTPVGVELDHYGAARGMRLKDAAGTEHWFPAHTVFVAAGTQPNTVLAREHGAPFTLDGKYFAACDEDGNAVKPQYSAAKPDSPQVLLSRGSDGRFVSFFGDVHPSYFGNVVKAMASAKQGYPIVSRILAKREPQRAVTREVFLDELAAQLLATVHSVERLTPTIVEVTLHAPLAAKKFQPGQFYRLQNFENEAPVARDTRLQMEGLAMTGASVDLERGLVSIIALEMGGSSNLCAMLKPGERVILMGPTGTPTHIESKETVILCGGGLGNAVLFSIGAAFRAAGSKVLYFAGYKKVQDRYKVSEIENAADVIVWCCDEEPGFAPTRPQDRTFVGNIVQAMDSYAEGLLGECTIRLDDGDRIIAIGSDRMMAAVAQARHDVLKEHLKPHHFAIGSINSPMQCMMKEICAQCLQPHRDPETGKTSYVFSCFNQDQPLDSVDWKVLNDRLKQNSLVEKLTVQWLRQCMPELQAQRQLV